jgi:DNA-binding response OmpR family regulator
LGVKIIMMTGNPERIVEFDAARQPYLSKPFPAGALVEKVREVLTAIPPPDAGTG